MNDKQTCSICKMLFYQDIAENSLTISGQRSQSKVAYYRKLVEQCRVDIIQTRSMRSLHICSDAHKQIATTLRSGHRALHRQTKEEKEKQVQAALQDYKKWLLKLGELKQRVGTSSSIGDGKTNIFDIEIARAEAMVAHYRTLHAQRLRRLRESGAAKQ